MMRRFLVILEKTATGYSTYAPDLPGCVAGGDSRAEAEKNMYEAIQLHLEGLAAEGLPLPEPNAESEVLVLH